MNNAECFRLRSFISCTKCTTLATLKWLSTPPRQDYFEVALNKPWTRWCNDSSAPRIYREHNPAVWSLPTNDAFWQSSVFSCMLSVGAIHFEDRFCASRKGGTGKGGWMHHSSWQCMVVVAAAYRKALVNTRWAICLLSCTNRQRKCSVHLVGTPFLAF